MLALRLAQSLGSGKVGGGSPPAAVEFIFSVKTDNAGTSADNQFELPLYSSGAISMDVDWGDGTTDTITSYNQAEKLHTYASSGTYTIQITNEVRGWKFTNWWDKDKMLDISNWGEFNFTNDRAFMSCSNMTCSATDVPTVSTSSMSAAFYGCTNFNGDISGFDMSGVTTINIMLYNCTNFNGDIGGWNTSLITDFSYALFGGASFDQDISSWDINQATNLSFFLYNGTLSTANYDALLIGWESQAPTSGLTPNFGSSTYTLGGQAAIARASLISTYGWTITDGGGI